MMNDHTPASDSRHRFGLYLHIPFCVKRCDYCDFVSYALSPALESLRSRYVDLLRRELRLAIRAHPELAERRLDSVYFGGGTPSLLTPAEAGVLLGAAREAFSPAADLEVTLECNPVTSLSSILHEFRDNGVDRLSLGVQSFDDEKLRRLGRAHSAREAECAIEIIQSLGFRSLGLDLIFGAPIDPATEDDDFALERWRRDLDAAIAHGPPHISLYGLTLHEGTRMMEAFEQGEITLPSEETQREMYLEARHMLQSAGWRHYEISNFARPGHESRHNSLYWTGGEYLGLGVAAHSFFGGRRRANPSDIEEYRSQIERGEYPAQAESCPSVSSLRGERIMLALRRCEGVSPKELSRWIGCDFLTKYREEIQRLSENGLIQCSAENVRLTEEGLLLSDTVFEEFFQE